MQVDTVTEKVKKEEMVERVTVGLLGHVDHGKTTLVKALTGKWTDTYKEELLRGISIKLGYADLGIYECNGKYTTSEKCRKGKAKPAKIVSFLDAPGHESLMATAVSASAVIDGALFLIAANEPCPQEQTKEHFMILEMLGIKDIVIVQTKLDLVTEERARESYKEIKAFLKGTFAEDAPIIPISGTAQLNIDRVIEAIVKYIEPKPRDKKAPPLFYILRSFDINKPGTPIARLKGGVLGGVIERGTFKKGQSIKILPGIPQGKSHEAKPIETTVVSLHIYEGEVSEAEPGGTVAIGTQLDPTLTKGDRLVGNVVVDKNETDVKVYSSLPIKYKLLERKDIENPPFREGEVLLLNVGSATTAGIISAFKKGVIEVQLRKSVAALKGTAVAIQRRVGQRWRLAAVGSVE